MSKSYSKIFEQLGPVVEVLAVQTAQPSWTAKTNGWRPEFADPMAFDNDETTGSEVRSGSAGSMQFSMQEGPRPLNQRLHELIARVLNNDTAANKELLELIRSNTLNPQQLKTTIKTLAEHANRGRTPAQRMLDAIEKVVPAPVRELINNLRKDKPNLAPNKNPIANPAYAPQARKLAPKWSKPALAPKPVPAPTASWSETKNLGNGMQEHWKFTRTPTCRP